MPMKELWFEEDGDVLLVNGEHQYLLHKSVLSSKSSVFADTFSMPLPADGDDDESENLVGLAAATGTSVPVVHMHDKPEPFTLFLHALYDHHDHITSSIPTLGRKTVPLISSIIDLADKYGVTQPDMRETFLPFIERDWPSTLAEWDTNEYQILQLSKELGKKDALETLDDLLPDPAAVIRFAHDHKVSTASIQPIPSFIPAAFYHLSRLPPYADPDDVTLNDDYLSEGGRTANKALLYRQDLILLAHGVDSLRDATARIAFVELPACMKGFAGASDGEKEVMMTWWRNFGIEKLLGCERRDLIHDLKVIMDALQGEFSPGHLDDHQLVELRKSTSQSYRDVLWEFLKREREQTWTSLANYFSLYAFYY